jgi:hypothetical protein
MLILLPASVGRAGNQLFLFASSYGIARSKGMKVIINYNCQLLKVFNLKVDIRQDTSICNSPKVKIHYNLQNNSPFDSLSNIDL